MKSLMRSLDTYKPYCCPRDESADDYRQDKEEQIVHAGETAAAYLLSCS